MKVLCFGIGRAGSRVLEALRQYERRTSSEFIVDAVAHDTDSDDLRELQVISEANRTSFGVVETNGGGVGGDLELASELASEDSLELLRSIDGAPVSKADAFLLFAGLGGGTGSGAAPVLAKELRRIYTQPIYGVGILPALEEAPRCIRNAAQSLETLVEMTDHVFAFDNARWTRHGDDLNEAYESLNERFTQDLGRLLGAGEVSDGSVVAESVIDASEIINTLRGGGVATVGYADSRLPEGDESDGLIHRLLGERSSGSVDEIDAINRITTHTREALHRLSLSCDVASASRGLVVVDGPPEWLNRKAIEESRTWVEAQTESMEIRGGDAPRPNADSLGVFVLLGGVSRSERIDGLRSVGDADQE
jgi:cell division GTPase FtsZ